MTDGSAAGRILVIENDRGTASLLRTLLEGRGYSVRVAFDGLSGIAATQAEAYSLIMVDTVLPGLSGEELVSRLSKDERIRDTPVVMLAPQNDYQQRVRLFELGVDDYFVRPFSPLELLSRVQALLRRSVTASAPLVGEVIVFFGCAGGIGTTTLCVNVAQALGARAPTVVMDAAWPLGAVGLTLGSPQEDGLQQIAASREPPRSLEEYLAGGRAGIRFRYLNGYDSLTPPTAPTPDMGTILDGLATAARYVIVDAGTASSPFAADCLRQADVTVAVMAFERTHLALMRAYTEYLDLLGVRRGRRLIVGSRIRPSPLGVHDVGRQFGIPLAVVVPNEAERLARCASDGSLLITQYPECAGAIAMTELAATLTRQTSVES